MGFLVQYTSGHPFTKDQFSEARRLCKKWINRRLTEDECYEFTILLEDIIDTDVCYILYGFPYGTVEKPEGYTMAFEGLFEIGNKEPIQRKRFEQSPSDIQEWHSLPRISF